MRILPPLRHITILLSPLRPLHDGRLASRDTQTDHRGSWRTGWTPTCLWAIRIVCVCVCVCERESTFRLLLQLQCTLDPVHFSPDSQEPEWPNKHTLLWVTAFTCHVSRLSPAHIYLRIALAQAPHSPQTHHADAQDAYSGVDVRSLLRHDEEAEWRHAQPRRYQAVPVRFPLHHRCWIIKLSFV